MATESESVDPFAAFRQFLALERDVLVLSLAMFAFSLGFQMTGRYMGRYLSVLGAGSVIIGLYGSLGTLISAAYPYPGGAISDRIGSRTALTAFGLASTFGFLLWFLAPELSPADSRLGVDFRRPPAGPSVEVARTRRDVHRREAENSLIF